MLRHGALQYILKIRLGHWQPCRIFVTFFNSFTVLGCILCALSLTVLFLNSSMIGIGVHKLLQQISRVSAALALAATSTLASAQLGTLNTDLVYTPITPCRLIDTRSAVAGQMVAGSVRTFNGWTATNFASQGGDGSSNCNIPATTDTAAIVVNFTIVTPTAGGYITAFPSNVTQPVAASLNFNAGDVKGNNAILKLSQASNTNQLSIYTTSTTHLVADVVGYYAKPTAAFNVAINTDLVYNPVTPCRIMDTRNAGAAAGMLDAGSTRSFLGWNGSYTVQGGDNTACGLPFSTNNAAIVLNFTVVSPNASGYITAFPANAARPLAATLNFGAGEVKGNNAFLKLNQTDGQADFNVYSTAATHLVADVVGYYAKPVALGSANSDLVYTPVTPCRIMDTRSAASGALTAAGTRGFLGWTSTNFTTQGGANTTCGLQADTNNAAIAVNFTIVSPSSGGYITAYPANAAQPLAATLNFNAGDVKGSNAILKLNQTGTGSHFNIYSTSATHLVADVVGYYAKPK